MLSYTNGEKYEVPDLELNSSTKFHFFIKLIQLHFYYTTHLTLTITSYFDCRVSGEPTLLMARVC